MHSRLSLVINTSSRRERSLGTIRTRAELLLDKSNGRSAFFMRRGHYRTRCALALLGGRLPEK